MGDVIPFPRKPFEIPPGPYIPRPDEDPVWWAENAIRFIQPHLDHHKARLARGVYERGPRKGQPFDRRTRRELEDRIAYHRGEIAEQRAKIARLTGGRPEASA